MCCPGLVIVDELGEDFMFDSLEYFPKEAIAGAFEERFGNEAEGRRHVEDDIQLGASLQNKAMFEGYGHEASLEIEVKARHEIFESPQLVINAFQMDDMVAIAVNSQGDNRLKLVQIQKANGLHFEAIFFVP